MVLRVKVAREDFLEAETNGWIDGQLDGKSGIWVYVELGQEVEYIPQDKDNPKTDYRLFMRCDVFYATSQKMLEDEEWLLSDKNIAVIIYC